MVRLLRSTLWALTLVGVALTLVYAFFPSLAEWLLARQASAFDLSSVQVKVARPRMDGIRIEHVRIHSPAFALEVTDARLGWTGGSLVAGRLTEVVAREASLTLRSGLPSAGGVAGTAEGGVLEAPAAAAGSLFGGLPFDRGRVDRLSVDVPALDARAEGDLAYEDDTLSIRLDALSPQRALGLTLTGRLSGRGSIELDLAERDDDGAPFLRVQSALPEARLELIVDARLSGFPLDLVSTLGGLPVGNGLVTGRWALTCPWPPVEGFRWTDVAGRGPVRADWRSADGRFVVSGLSGQVLLEGGTVRLTELGGQLDVVAEGVRIAAVPAQVTLTPDTAALAAEGTVHIESGSMTVDGRTRALISPGAEGGQSVTGDLAGTLELGGQTFPVQLTSHGVLEPPGYSGRLVLTSGLLEAVPVDVVYRTADAHTGIRVKHRLSFSKPLLRALWPGWREPFDLDGGTLEVDLDLAVTPADGIGGQGVVGLSRVAAHAGPAAIRGLTGSLAVRLEDGVPKVDPSVLRASLVDFGVPLRNLETRLSASMQQVNVATTTLELLGGRATVEPFRYPLETGEVQTTVTLTDLDLSRVLALEGEHITGSGRLDGTLPFRLADGQISVESGRIIARSPGGDLRLQPSIAGAITQPGLDLALAALTDFHYALLEADVSYSPTGDLALGIRLEGRNPDVEKGRPFHFNLNVSENIPVLLRSLRLKDEFAERIERRVQR